MPYQKFREKYKDPATIPEPWIQDPKSFGPFSFLSNYSVKEKPSKSTLGHGQSDAMLGNSVARHVLLESTFKNKTPQGMEHVWCQRVSYIYRTNPELW